MIVDSSDDEDDITFAMATAPAEVPQSNTATVENNATAVNNATSRDNATEIISAEINATHGINANTNESGAGSCDKSNNRESDSSLSSILIQCSVDTSPILSETYGESTPVKQTLFEQAPLQLKFEPSPAEKKSAPAAKGLCITFNTTA